VASGEIVTIAVPGGLRVAFWCFRPLRPGAVDRFDRVMRVCERLVSVASGSRKRDLTRTGHVRFPQGKSACCETVRAASPVPRVTMLICT
jgi:hypothetical protein